MHHLKTFLKMLYLWYNKLEIPQVLFLDVIFPKWFWYMFLIITVIINLEKNVLFNNAGLYCSDKFRTLILAVEFWKILSKNSCKKKKKWKWVLVTAISWKLYINLIRIDYFWKTFNFTWETCVNYFVLAFFPSPSLKWVVSIRKFAFILWHFSPSSLLFPFIISSVQLSHSVVSDYLQPHGL